jgi:hypothetical protein
MEPQTRFNLNAALQNWREELAAQINLTPEARRELETHLTDTVVEMQQRGLNDEEAFWLARRRVGQPKELGEEFTKAAFLYPCRQWVLWITLALYGIHLWTSAGYLLWMGLFFRMLPPSFSPQIASTLNYLAVALLGIYLARTRSAARFMGWLSFIRAHGRLLAISTFLVFDCLENVSLARFQWLSLLFTASRLIWPLTLVAIILWLLPSEKQRTLQHT